MEISQNFVAFSEYMNFNFPNLITHGYFREGRSTQRKIAANLDKKARRFRLRRWSKTSAASKVSLFTRYDLNHFIVTFILASLNFTT